MWPFIVIDVVVGVVSPILIIFSIIPIARIVQYVSHNRLDTRKLLLWFLPFLGYEKGTKGVYWVLEESFHYKIHNGICGGLSTALLYTSAALAFLFSWVYFIDDVLIEQKGLNSCVDLNSGDQNAVTCFYIHPTNINMYVNCTENSSYANELFCFEFKEVGRNSNILQSLVISIILYYISVICISLTFQVMNFLQQNAQSYLWPTLLVTVGFFASFFGVVHFISALYFNHYLNILTLFQILILSANIIVVGILVAGGQFMHDPQSFSENTSVMLNTYQIHDRSHSINMQEINRPEIEQEIEVLAHPLHEQSQDNVSLPTGPPTTPPSPESLPPPAPTNSVSPPPPSSTPPPPISSASTLETSSNRGFVAMIQPATTTADQETNQSEGGVIQQVSEDQLTDVTLGAPKTAVVRPKVMSGPAFSLNSQALLHAQRASGRMPYIPMAHNYFVLPDQPNVPFRVQYANVPPASTIVPIPTAVYMPTHNNSASTSISRSSATVPPAAGKRITIL